MNNLVKLGPKEMKGSIWDQRGSFQVEQILISHQKNTINSIQFAFVLDGDMFLTGVYGEPTGLKFDTITFDFLEKIVSVSGEYDSDGILVSFAFRTDKKSYGPFGGSDHPDSRFEKFDYNFGPSVCFCGFHGSVYDSRVSAIGVYVRPLARAVDKDDWDNIIVTR